MKARALANMLLEMNILNSKDVNRELNKIAARIYDKRAKEWMLRVGKYFLLNINELIDKPANLYPEAHPRNPYYFHPEQGFIETERMRLPAEPRTEPMSPDRQWVFQLNSDPYLFLNAFGDVEWVKLADATIFPSPKLPDEVSKWKDAGNFVRTVDIKGPKTPADVKKEQFATHYGLESRKKPGHYYTNKISGGHAGPGPLTTNKEWAWATADEEALKDKELAVGGSKLFKRVKLERYAESRSVRMASFILEARDKNRPPYSTMLHTRPEFDPGDPRWGELGKATIKPPFWQRAREQAFKPFNPKKAKTSALPGEGPTKADVKDWMFDPEGRPKELQHFDPWDTNQQEVWQVLNDIADWFNYVYSDLRAGKRDDELIYQQVANQSLYLNEAGEWGPLIEAIHYEKDDIQGAEVPPGGRWVNPAIEKARKADEYLDRLKSHQKDDVDAFRDVVMDAHEFIHDTQHSPTRFIKDSKVVGKSGNISIRRTTSFEATKAAQCRPGYTAAETGNTKEPTWCVKTEAHYPTYANTPLYFVEKNGKPYVLVHWPTNQAKIENNTTAPAAVMKEIAPAFAANKREFTDDMLNQAAQSAGTWGASETGRLAQEILKVRQGAK